MDEPEKRRELTEDELAIDEIVRQFFDLFTNIGDRIPNVRNIESLFVSEGILINNTSGNADIYNLESFIKPREELLSNGTLRNFIEKETSHNTELYRNIAQRSCSYEKSGELNGEPFIGGGKKLMQFIKRNDQWLLSSVIWLDED